jgi:D-aminopeptidase
VAPAEAQRLIHAGAARALATRRAPLLIERPVTIAVEFALTQHADQAELTPGSTRTGGRTITYTHPDYREVFRAFRAMYSLAATA